MPVWYERFPWITICATRKKVFCVQCRQARSLKMLSFSKKGDDAFTTKGFNNFKKAIEKFRIHETCETHLEAQLKCSLLGKKSISEQLSSLTAKVQNERRCGFLKQLQAMQYLLRQGLALRGHVEKEGNLTQLLMSLSEDDDILKSWVRDGKYMSHEIITQIICLMGQSILRVILNKINSSNPPWFAVICDETTDVACKEQLNVSIRYVDDDYVVHEDTVGLFNLPNTSAETISEALKDILVRCNLPISMCRGQAYDGAAAMQGKRKGVATLIQRECPAAASIHCFAHCLNLCLQDASRTISLIRDSFDVVKEIEKLILWSPKRKHLFSTQIQSHKSENDSGNSVGLRRLCPTRWTM